MTSARCGWPRYLGPEQAASGEAAVSWIETNRPYPFFTDTGGFRWMVDVHARRAAAAAAVEAGAGK